MFISGAICNYYFECNGNLVPRAFGKKITRLSGDKMGEVGCRITCDQAFLFILFFSGNGEKKNARYIYITSRVVSRAQVKVSVNICVIVSNFTGNSSGLHRRRILSTCVYLLSRQTVNFKLIR